MPSKCVIVDLETVPDQKVVLDDKAFEFPLPIFHKIACIGYAVLGNSFDLQKVRVLGLNEQSEEEALREFGKEIDDDTMVVTWSGRRFDVPVILYRSMKYGIPCSWHFRRDFDKRFGLTGHVDLQDHMMLFGASDKIKLDHAAAMIGLPGKLDTVGADVAALWARNRFRTIGTYCVTDVIQNVVLFIRWAHLRGLASTEEVNAALDSISSYSSVSYLPTSPASQVSVAEGIHKVVSNCDWESLKIRRL
jgi:predicted PolB exonuclease-like 3'-5' exonuclease